MSKDKKGRHKLAGEAMADAMVEWAHLMYNHATAKRILKALVARICSRIDEYIPVKETRKDMTEYELNRSLSSAVLKEKRKGYMLAVSRKELEENTDKHVVKVKELGLYSRKTVDCDVRRLLFKYLDRIEEEKNE
jgi:hypothetical protein